MAKSKRSKPVEPKPQSSSPAASESLLPEATEPDSESLQKTRESNEAKEPPPKESFESYYLKRVTAEFADDIDKIRNASDFNERSVPVLVQALKQSAADFTEEEKARVMDTKRSAEEP